eukprot:759820-Hanusia_phi.AAC.2
MCVGEATEACRANEEQGKDHDDPGEEVSQRAMAALSSYEKMHAKILDPREKKPKKKFLVLQVTVIVSSITQDPLTLSHAHSLSWGWATLRSRKRQLCS